MTDEELLFKRNTARGQKRYSIRNGGIYYHNSEFIVDGTKIKEIMGFIKNVNKKYNNTNIPIILDLGKVEFKDKLTYIILECICHCVMTVYGKKVIILCNVQRTIWTEGIYSSVLPLLSSAKSDCFVKFTDNFMGEIYGRHYRKIVKVEDWNDKYLNCKIMEQVDWFLKNLHVDKENRDALSEVVSELAGNVHDHVNGDCLIDIDVTLEYEKEDDIGEYYGVNLVVLNFSSKLFGEGIREKLNNGHILNERFKIVKEAYKNHQRLFSGENYVEEDFFNITAFQHKISGREKDFTNGGTGLTKLISSLQERSETHNCYMISGKRAIFFRQELLHYDEEKWIGFNDNNNYFDEKPSDTVLGGSYIFFPGTAYNLNFVMRKEEENGKQV